MQTNPDILSPEWAYEYARHVIKGRWPEAEPVIMQSPEWACTYAIRIIEGRWPEAEPVIMQDSESFYLYARYAIKGRWLEAESYLTQSRKCAHQHDSLIEVSNQKGTKNAN